jgi:hypothetical protein
MVNITLHAMVTDVNVGSPTLKLPACAQTGQRHDIMYTGL